MWVRKSTKPLKLELASQIAGWMTYDELSWLARQAQTHNQIVEIGSYQGRSTRALGDNTSGTVFAIDDFIGPRDASIPQAVRNNLFEIFMYGLGDLIQQQKVVPIVADHRQIDTLTAPDMVFIDGSHEYQDVKADIAHWWPRLAKGGLLCGHDHQFPSVQQAVTESFQQYKVAPQTTIWYSIKDN